MADTASDFEHTTTDVIATAGVASRLGLGLAAIGRPAYITVGRDADLGAGPDRSVDSMRRRAHRLLDEAWMRGIRYFDAARSYGLAEQFLGSWLADHPSRRAELTIGSKWGYEYVGDWHLDAAVQERKDHGLRMLDTQWPETLAALGGSPDVYLIHSLTPESPALGDPALLDRLRELQAGGVRMGFSTSGPHQAEVIDRVLGLLDSPFSAVQSTWNLLEQSAGAALARANDAQWLVVVKESLANGRLTARGEEAAGSAVAAGSSSAAGSAARTGSAGNAGAESGAEVAAGALARESGQSLAGFALGAALAQPWADIVLTGAVTGDQLRENLLARPPAATLDGDALAALAEPPERYWATRSARPWT